MKLIVIATALLLALTAQAQTTPCTKATTACTEWITFQNGPSRSMVYRTYPLTGTHPGVTRAFILVHGAGRDADQYFRTAIAAAFLAGALENTLVLSPRFASAQGGCRDSLADNEVSWSCSGDSWRSGGTAASNDRINSYDLMDEILRQLASKKAFPNLKSIVLAGHSAGGQYVTRYQMVNQVHEQLGVPVHYIVSNPSSYAYLDADRPTADGSAFHAFGDSRNCTTYDRWPYGLQQRTGASAKLTEEQMKRSLAGRRVTYLLGEIDILPLGGFDGSCPAMAQGATRLARGQAYHKYAAQKYGASHQLTVVPLCGHNARCMFTSETALPLLFPQP